MYFNMASRIFVFELKDNFFEIPILILVYDLLAIEI